MCYPLLHDMQVGREGVRIKPKIVSKEGTTRLCLSGEKKDTICREGGYQKFTYVGDLRYQKSRFVRSESFISWEGWATKSFHISGGMWMVTKV